MHCVALSASLFAHAALDRGRLHMAENAVRFPSSVYGSDNMKE